MSKLSRNAQRRSHLSDFCLICVSTRRVGDSGVPQVCVGVHVGVHGDKPRVPHRVGRSDTPLRVGVEQATQEGGRRRGEARVRRRPGEDHLQLLRCGAAGKGWLPREQQVQQHSERPQQSSSRSDLLAKAGRRRGGPPRVGGL